MTRDEFIEKANKKHENKYDYSLVEYVNSTTKVKIICPEHGEFLKSPEKHLTNQGCKICSNKSRAEKKRYTTEVFIEKAKKVHGDKYDYSLVVYVDCDTKIKIICKEHGIFEQKPNNHLNLKQGCSKCVGNFKSNTSDFIDKANKKHGFKYDYSKVEYINNETKVCIVCPEHGEFWQNPNNHANQGGGCPKCVGLNKTTHEWIIQAKLIHGDKYDYSKVKYVNSKDDLIIVCYKHGNFTQPSHRHLQGQGCPKCSNEINKWNYRTDQINNEIFIARSKEQHGDKFDYSKVEYTGIFNEVIIICPQHGEFSQTAKSHMDGNGCGKCSGRYMDTKYFIEKASKIHNNKYDYSKVIYTKGDNKVTIICPIHGEFEQTATSHLCNHGCWSCSESKGEKIIREILTKKSVKYTTNKKFDECKDKRKLPFDFYLPKHNICVEYDGIQHYDKVEYFGGYYNFLEIQKRDKIKTQYCIDNNIKLIRIPYTEFDNIEEILKKELKI